VLSQEFVCEERLRNDLGAKFYVIGVFVPHCQGHFQEIGIAALPAVCLKPNHVKFREFRLTDVGESELGKEKIKNHKGSLEHLGRATIIN